MRSGEPILPEPAERDWFRTHLIGDLLPRWLWAVGSPSGIFIPHLDREWRRTREGPATLVSQARLLYNFATGFRLTGEEAYAEAVRLGADALIARFGDGPPGCWAWSVDGDGSIRDAHRSAYGYAFVVFGLAHAFAATGDARYRSAALDTARVIFARFGERDGGFIPTLRPNWSDAGATRTQNPIMHLFEALLALGHEGGAPEMLAEAAGVARFLCDRLMRDDGTLPELFADDWGELPESDGGRIDVGHQFESAFLLARAAEVGAFGGAEATRMVETGRTLLDSGMRIGYDPDDAGVWSPATPDGAILTRSKGWWEQCEAARALLRYSTMPNGGAYDEPYRATVEMCRRRFVDPIHGGWFMRVEPDGAVAHTDKGNEWKVDYHVVGLCAEALRDTE